MTFLRWLSITSPWRMNFLMSSFVSEIYRKHKQRESKFTETQGRSESISGVCVCVCVRANSCLGEWLNWILMHSSVTYAFLEHLNFIVEFVDVVEQREVLVFDFNEPMDEFVNVSDACSCFDLFKCFFV
jgi:hypothetical protein